MAINFIKNDPDATGAAVEQITPAPDRPAGSIGFRIDGLPTEQPYPKTSADFVAWQAREAALRALSIFEGICGPLPGWTGVASRKSLNLYANLGQDLNAYYDRDSVSFFEFQVGTRKVYSGASTDVVAHEVGHAILDALRPDLWSVSMLEAGAFHEGFGDCIALMTALADQQTRIDILQGDNTLSKANFVETTAEQLSHAIGKAISPNHNAAKPRHALSTFVWALPQTLPADGKPGVLINEIHSFGQLTSGCHYQLIREMFLAGPGGEAGLWNACQTATKLLVEGVKSAQIRPRFLESVGRSMVLADRAAGVDANGAGANEKHIKTAFDRHGISLSVTNFLAPRAALATAAAPSKAAARGRSRKAAAAAAELSAPVKKQLRSMFDIGSSARLEAKAFELGGSQGTEVTGYRAVDLSGLSPKLSNVKAMTPQVAIVGTVAATTAVLGSVDPGVAVSAEVRDFVAMLVRRKQIDYSGTAGKPSDEGKKPRGASGMVATEKRPTHTLKKRGSETVLERICFGCGCGFRRWR